MPRPPRESLASAKAKHRAPAPLTNQPRAAFHPSGANDTGSMKMPAPMIEPTTIDSRVGNPTVWPLFWLIRLAPYTDLTAEGVRIPMSEMGRGGSLRLFDQSSPQAVCQFDTLLERANSLMSAMGRRPPPLPT